MCILNYKYIFTVLAMTTSMDMITAVVTSPMEVESSTTTSTIIPELHQQNLFISTSGAEVSKKLNCYIFIGTLIHYNVISALKPTAGTILVMLVEQQELSPIQPQYHQESFIVPTTTTTTSVLDTTTMTLQDSYGNEDGDENHDKVINVESETTDIKQVLF